jgi:Bacterial aa3 type cytochrome c oxidase subunit IV
VHDDRLTQANPSESALGRGKNGGCPRAFDCYSPAQSNSVNESKGLSAMANAPTHYKKGSQDMRAHNDTYAVFWAITKWGIIVNVIILIALAYFFT